MNTIKLYVDQAEEKINKEIYGHFAEHLGRCIYEGIWVGEDSNIPNFKGIRKDVIEALRKIDIPVIRWPGGCFADEYHWKDGIGPREKRKKIVNTHWGKVVENNHFGTHEFLYLCELLDTEPYICGNVGSGTVQEMQQWIEYMTFPGKSPMADWRRENGRDEPWEICYFGIGNENWACGGNMRAENYADLYRRYQTYVRNYGDIQIYKIACGTYGDNYKWTDILMDRAGEYMDGISFHHYIVPGTWEDKGSATDFTTDEWYTTMKKTLKMDELIRKHSKIMDKYDPERRVGLILDEWGSWHTVEEGTNPRFLFQQNTMRDALVAGICLNIFNNHCDRVKMANIAQIVNVLQALILTKGEKMILTPTYHVFDMYKAHQNSLRVPYQLDIEKYREISKLNISASVSATKNSNSQLNITICNLDPDNHADLELIIYGKHGDKINGTVLSAQDIYDHNTFENQDNVGLRNLEGLILDKEKLLNNTRLLDDDKLKINLPSASITLITIDY